MNAQLGNVITFWLPWQPPHDEVQGGHVGTDGGHNLGLALQSVVDLHLQREGEGPGRLKDWVKYSGWLCGQRQQLARLPPGHMYIKTQ